MNEEGKYICDGSFFSKQFLHALLLINLYVLLCTSYSLLSHSAVVARELGLPTIVGVSGGLMKRLKVKISITFCVCHFVFQLQSGMKVHLDAGKVCMVLLDWCKLMSYREN